MATALSLFPARVRSAGGVPEEVLRAALPAGWRCEHAPATVSDTAVALVRGPQGPAGALKVAMTPGGAACLRRERDVLSSFSGDERLGAARAVLPEPLRWGEALGREYLLMSRLPGRDARDVPRGELARLTLAAFHEVGTVHRLGETAVRAEAAMLGHWADEPAAHLRGAVRARHAVDEVVTAIHAGLAGQPLRLGTTHGDFHPGNVLSGPDGQVSGILDWDQARTGDPVALDLAFWLLTLPGDGRRREFGGRVAAKLRAREPWTPAEANLLGEAASLPPAAGRSLLLLVWLRHVGGNLAKSGRYAASPLWLHRNVRPVLRTVSRG